jgi:hypothetical protein
MLQQTEYQENDGDHQQQVQQVAAEHRVPPPAEVSEQPKQNQNDDDEFQNFLLLLGSRIVNEETARHVTQDTRIVSQKFNPSRRAKMERIPVLIRFYP